MADNADRAKDYGCETYEAWLTRVLRAGDIDELRRGRVR